MFHLIRSLIAVFLLLLPLSAMAQELTTTTTTTTTTIPENLQPAQVAEIVSGLSDKEVRSILLERLDAVAAKNSATETGQEQALSELVSTATSGVAASVIEAVRRVPLLAQGQGRAFSAFYSEIGLQGLLMTIGLLLASLLIGYIVERFVRFAFDRWVNLDEFVKTSSADSLRDVIWFLSMRLLSEVIGLAVFFIAAGYFLDAFAPERAERLMHGVMFNLVFIPRVAIAFSRFFLSPQKPQYRLVHTDQWTAEHLMFHQAGFAMLIGFSAWILQFNVHNDVSLGELRLGFWLNLAQHVYLGWIFWRCRAGLSMMMRGDDTDISSYEARIARWYPGFMIFLTALMWYVVAILGAQQQFAFLQTFPHFKTLLLLGMAPAMDTAIRGLVRHLVPPMQGEGPVAERAYLATKRSYVRIGRVIVMSFVLLQVAGIWGLSFTGLASASIGAQFAADLVEFFIVLAIGYLILELVSLWINRKLAAEMTAAGVDPESEEAGEGGGAGGSRLSTVLPLILMVSRAAIVVIFVLLALGTLGIDTTPLLAGAGIVGLAIGFGAQKLVTNVVSGIFFLIDDAFRNGEYIEVDGTMGTVEKISLSSMQLRHHRGLVHTIPYGEIPKLTNYSRDWVIMKLKFTVPFGTDPNKVKKIFKQIGAEMLEHEELGQDFLQPFKSQGVLEIDDIGMVIRGKFMAKPGKQFMIRKEIFNRVNAAFEANGIEFARREVRVAIPSLESSDQLTDAQKAEVAGVASAAVGSAMDAYQGNADDR